MDISTMEKVIDDVVRSSGVDWGEFIITRSRTSPDNPTVQFRFCLNGRVIAHAMTINGIKQLQAPLYRVLLPIAQQLTAPAPSGSAERSE